jgi:ABC-type branched-subunit amino acid transport system substrate-binding protein
MIGAFPASTARVMHHSSMNRRAFVRTGAAAGGAAVAALLRGSSRPNPLAALGGPGRATPLHAAAVLPPGDGAWPGIQLGAAEARHAAALFGTTFELHEVIATGADAAAAAQDVIRDHDAAVLIGGADAASADALAAVAASSGLLFLNIGVAPDDMQRRCDPHVFHLRPSKAVRHAAVEAFGEARAGTRAAVWHPRLVRFGAAQVIERFERTFDTAMDESAWAGWLAVKIVFDAVQRTGTTDTGEIAGHLASADAVFDGHKGRPLTFNPASHELRQPLYIVAAGELLGEVPQGRGAGGTPPSLDALRPESDTCVR